MFSNNFIKSIFCCCNCLAGIYQIFKAWDSFQIIQNFSEFFMLETSASTFVLESGLVACCFCVLVECKCNFNEDFYVLFAMFNAFFMIFGLGIIFFNLVIYENSEMIQLMNLSISLEFCRAIMNYLYLNDKKQNIQHKCL